MRAPGEGVATLQAGTAAEPCRKRRFGSARAVRLGHAGARFRVRAYQCDRPGCGAWHATASEKRRGRYSAEVAQSSQPLAPVRTLAEVEAIAQGMRGARG